MAIEFRCTNCQKLLRTPDDAAGKQAKCPECRTVLPIPESSTTGYGIAPSEVPPHPSQATASPGPRSPAAGTSSAVGERGNPFAVPLPGAASTGAEAGEARETFNPYQAPSGTGAGVGYVHEDGEHAFGHRRISAIEVLETTWQIYKANFGACIAAIFASGASFLGIVLFIGVAVAALTELANANEVVVFAVQMIFGFIMMILGLWLFLGLADYFMAVARDEQPQLALVFAGGNHLLPALGASVLLYIAVNIISVTFACPAGVVAGAVAAAAGGDPTGTMVLLMVAIYGVLFLIYVGMWAFFGQYAFLIVDRDAGVIQSLTESARIMRGNKFAALFIFFVGGVIAMLGALLIGIGMILTVPYFFLLLTVTYLSITGQIGDA